MNRNKKLILLLLIVIIGTFILGGCKKEDAGETGEVNEIEGGENMGLNQLEPPAKGEEIAIITTNYGDIKIRLFPEIAPKAVENFKTHAKNGYYNGLIFHRVIPNFMIQGGDPQGNGTGGESIWGTPFEDEFDINYHNFRGSLSMANAGPNTNGSQFFIVQNREANPEYIKQMKELGEDKGYPELVIDAYEKLGGAPWLDFQHTVFGQVFEGMDVVDKIANVETNENDKPLEDVIMEKVKIVKYK